MESAAPVVQTGLTTQPDNPILDNTSCQANQHKVNHLVEDEPLPSAQPEPEGADGQWAHWMS